MSRPDEYRSRLIAARERLGLSRREMAKRLLTPRVTYEQWEDDKRRTPGVAVVAAERYAHRPNSESMTAQIIATADGTLSAREIAEKLGFDVAIVKRLVITLKHRGRLAPEAVRRGMKTVRNLKYSEALIDQVVELVRAGASMNSAAAQATGQRKAPFAVVIRAAKKCDELGISRIRRVKQ